MRHEPKEHASPSHEQGWILPLSRVRSLLLLFVLWLNLIVAAAAEQYPWSSDAANVAGRILAISHVVNSNNQEAGFSSKQDPARFRPANREIDPGPVGSALSGTRMSDVQLRSSQLQSESMLRMQEIRSRNQQMLAQSTAQMETLRSRNQEMLARSMSQRQDLQSRNQQMLARALSQRQDLQFRNQEMLARSMSQLQDLQFRNSQILSENMRRAQDTQFRDRQIPAGITKQVPISSSIWTYTPVQYAVDWYSRRAELNAQRSDWGSRATATAQRATMNYIVRFPLFDPVGIEKNVIRASDAQLPKLQRVAAVGLVVWEGVPKGQLIKLAGIGLHESQFRIAKQITFDRYIRAGQYDRFSGDAVRVANVLRDFGRYYKVGKGVKDSVDFASEKFNRSSNIDLTRSGMETHSRISTLPWPSYVSNPRSSLPYLAPPMYRTPLTFPSLRR